MRDDLKEKKIKSEKESQSIDRRFRHVKDNTDDGIPDDAFAPILAAPSVMAVIMLVILAAAACGDVMTSTSTVYPLIEVINCNDQPAELPCGDAVPERSMQNTDWDAVYRSVSVLQIIRGSY